MSPIFISAFCAFLVFIFKKKYLFFTTIGRMPSLRGVQVMMVMTTSKERSESEDTKMMIVVAGEMIQLKKA